MEYVDECMLRSVRSSAKTMPLGWPASGSNPERPPMLNGDRKAVRELHTCEAGSTPAPPHQDAVSSTM